MKLSFLNFTDTSVSERTKALSHFAYGFGFGIIIALLALAKKDALGAILALALIFWAAWEGSRYLILQDKFSEK